LNFILIPGFPFDFEDEDEEKWIQRIFVIDTADIPGRILPRWRKSGRWFGT
jgi:hypothetical protein